MIQPSEQICGTIERITYHNLENGFCVLRLKVKGQRDLVTLTSHIPVICAGEFIQATGHWFNDRNHGLQFKAMFLTATAPNTLEGLEKYLGSGMIKGIGEVYAKKLVTAFGKCVFDIIEQQPQLLKKVRGISTRRQQLILKGWHDQKAIREIMLFLHSHGISTTKAMHIYKTYAQEAIHIITMNPYQLAQDIKGIGFISADKIAQSMGIAADAMMRVRAGIAYGLGEALEDGHCGYPRDWLITSCCTLLKLEGQENLIEQALEFELQQGHVVQESVPVYLNQDGIKANSSAQEKIPCIFLKGLASAEDGIANKIKELCCGSLPWSVINSAAAISWVQAKHHITLSKTQCQAVAQALQSKVFIITGGPGVGKTTLVKSILAILQAKGIRIELAAPTGRAAKRLSETTGLLAKTLHRLLSINHEGDIQGTYRQTSSTMQLACDLLIIDETSMVDVMLMHKLLKALPAHAALFLVGDVDQLPSVGPGQILSDFLDCNLIPAIKLQEIFRQAASSQIITVAHQINQGIKPDFSKMSHSVSKSQQIDEINKSERLSQAKSLSIFTLLKRIPLSKLVKLY